MHEAEGVAGFMSGQLPNAREGHVVGLLERGRVVSEGIEQALGDEENLADSEGVEIDVAVDDLSGAGIGDGAAIGPATGGARNPFNDVVANIHGVDPFGQELHLKCVFVPRGGESLIPPGCAIEDSGTYGFGDGAIDVIDDGLDGFADGGGGIFFGETMMRDIALEDGLIDGSGEIHVGDAEEAGAGIIGAFVEAGRRSLDKRKMLVDGDGPGIGRDLFDPIAGILSNEGQSGFDVGVFGEIFGAGEIDRGARRINVIASLLERGESRRDFMDVAQEKWRSVDENGLAVFTLGVNFESPEHGLSEGLADGLLLLEVVGDGAVAFILSDQENARANALEMDDTGVAGLTTVEADVIRADTVGKGFVIKEGSIPLVDLQPELAAAGVPIIGEEAGEFFHARGFLGDGLQGRLGFWLRFGSGALCRCHGHEHEKCQTGKRDALHLDFPPHLFALRTLVAMVNGSGIWCFGLKPWRRAEALGTS